MKSRIVILTAILLIVFCVPAAASDFQKVIGRWQRMDGGYVIEIRQVDDEGKMDASYFNPHPIHVSRAQASVFKGTIKIEVVLNDVRYPGSKYTLIYAPDKDTLAGIYHHAPSGNDFSVVFARVK